jgi:hypothetical protein
VLFTCSAQWGHLLTSDSAVVCLSSAGGHHMLNSPSEMRVKACWMPMHFQCYLQSFVYVIGQRQLINTTVFLDTHSLDTKWKWLENMRQQRQEHTELQNSDKKSNTPVSARHKGCCCSCSGKVSHTMNDGVTGVPPVTYSLSAS